MASYLFPQQKVLCDKKPFSLELLRGLLGKVYAASPPFTGYFQFVGNLSPLYFLFFFNGAPYAAGRYSGGKSISYTIRELEEHLIPFAEEALTATLCETDPVLLKSMLLFLQGEPAVKAPTSLIDLENIVRQIDSGGGQAMIVLCRDNQFNFFFFRDGKSAIANYADQEFERPEGMTVDEEMLLYAFQPGSKVEAYIFHDMLTTEAADANLLDRDMLLEIFSGVKPEKNNEEISEQPVIESAVPIQRKIKLPSVQLTFESGPQQGEQFTVTLPCLIGRRDCDLNLDDGQVSRRHAKLKIVEHKLVIEDLASTNGTQVNGETVTQKRLSPNDLITIGESNLRITPA